MSDTFGDILLVLSDLEGGPDDKEFNTWYDNVHIPDQLETGEFINAKRYVRLNGYHENPS